MKIDDGNLSSPFTKMLEALDFVFDEGPEVGYHLKRTKGVYTYLFVPTRALCRSC